MNETSNYPLAETPTSEERLLAFIAHAGTLCSWFLAPLIVYLVKRDSKYVRLEALSALYWSILGTVLSILTVGLMIPVFLVVHLIAAYKTLEGKPFVYPYVTDLARKHIAAETARSVF